MVIIYQGDPGYYVAHACEASKLLNSELLIIIFSSVPDKQSASVQKFLTGKHTGEKGTDRSSFTHRGDRSVCQSTDGRAPLSAGTGAGRDVRGVTRDGSEPR